MHHFEVDRLTLQTIKEIWLPLLPYILGFDTVVILALFLTRPHRALHYEKFKPKIKPRNRIKHWIHTLWPFKPKTRSYSLTNRDRHIPKPTNEARISAVSSDIDRYCNRIDTRSTTTNDPGFRDRIDQFYTNIVARRYDGGGRNNFR